jgi:molybdenum cofactor biosynthesis enzyme MoaA
LEIEPTTACNLRCLACLVRDFDASMGWRDGLRDGGVSFALWDAARRLKHLVADLAHRGLARRASAKPSRMGRAMAMLQRGSIRPGRTGALSPETIRRVVSEAGPGVESVHFFGYGEPFLYPHLLLALRHVRALLPEANVVLSTNGTCVSPSVEDALVSERLVDQLIFSIDGSDEASYCRYRIRGDFQAAMENLARVHAKARGGAMRVVWQYVVFRWNDSDRNLRGALATAGRLGVPIWFDFARSTWGRSRRKAAEVEFLSPYLRADSRLPGR